MTCMMEARLLEQRLLSLMEAWETPPQSALLFAQLGFRARFARLATQSALVVIQARECRHEPPRFKCPRHLHKPSSAHKRD